jgi:simple sugar transport system substrate-binding protein
MNRTAARLFSIAALSLIVGGWAFGQDQLRFVMVTHGAASDPFWATVKDGADRAAQEAAIAVEYRAPAQFDVDAMARLVADAVAEKPDGLIVSVPNGNVLAAPIRAAVDAGIPVISINSGFDVGPKLGALLHVGQSEYEAGRRAGEAMRELGGTKALCLNHEPGNVALDLRCKGFIDGFGGSVEVLSVEPDPEAAREAIAGKLAADKDVDTILALNATVAGEPAIAAATALEGRHVRVGSFDTTEALLRAVADGKAAFAIDQQPFLQGYIPVRYLYMLAHYGVIPVSNVSTGPKLVRAEEAAERLGRASPPSGDAASGAEPKGG